MSDFVEAVTVVCIGVGAFLIGLSMGAEPLRKEAIERGCAEYNATTGEWQWKEHHE